MIRMSDPSESEVPDVLSLVREDYRSVGLFEDDAEWHTALETKAQFLEDAITEWPETVEDARLDGFDPDDPEVRQHQRIDFAGTLAGLRLTRFEVPDIVMQINDRLDSDGLSLDVEPNDYSPTRVLQLTVTGGMQTTSLDWRANLMDGFVTGVNEVLSLAGAPRHFISLDTMADYRIYVYGDNGLEQRLRASPLFEVFDTRLDREAGPA